MKDSYGFGNSDFYNAFNDEEYVEFDIDLDFLEKLV